MVQKDIETEDAEAVEAIAYGINMNRAIVNLADARGLPNRNEYYRRFARGQLDMQDCLERLAEKYFPGQTIVNPNVNWKQKIIFGEEMPEGTVYEGKA